MKFIERITKEIEDKLTARSDSERKLAAKIGCSRSFINCVMNRKTQITHCEFGLVVALCNELGVSIGEDDDPNDGK